MEPSQHSHTCPKSEWTAMDEAIIASLKADAKAEAEFIAKFDTWFLRIAGIAEET